MEEKPKTYIKVYPINPPNAYVGIYVDPLTKQYRYEVLEPKLFPKEMKIFNRIKEILYEELDIEATNLKREEMEKYLEEKIKEIIKKYKIRITEETIAKIMYYVKRNFAGYSKIDVPMRDSNIEDITCDGAGTPIYVWHREYESMPTNIIFETPEELDSFVIRLAYKAGKHVSVSQPIVDGALPDGSRVQVTFGKEVSLKGSSFTIRKFKRDPLTIVDLIKNHTLSTEMAAFFWFIIENRASILISGGVAAGKTTLLNALAIFIPPEFKIISIEETPEINLPHENWLQLVTRPSFGARETNITLFDLLKAAVRQRPDYLIVGEIRGEEAYTLFQAISTGHLSLSTMHADSVESVIRRLESEPMNIPRKLITAMDIITIQGRLTIANHPARRTLTVTEITGLGRNNEILTNEIYHWNQNDDVFEYKGRAYILERIIRRTTYTYESIQRELERRQRVLQWMAERNIRYYKEVSRIIREYRLNPDVVYRRATLQRGRE